MTNLTDNEKIASDLRKVADFISKHPSLEPIGSLYMPRTREDRKSSLHLYGGIEVDEEWKIIRQFPEANTWHQHQSMDDWYETEYDGVMYFAQFEYIKPDPSGRMILK